MNEAPAKQYTIDEAVPVTCSCGARTTVTYRRDLERYVAANPRWRFGLERDGRTFERTGSYGWYCGQEGHYQAEGADASEQDHQMGFENAINN